jgi:hypothetical protein
LAKKLAGGVFLVLLTRVIGGSLIILEYVDKLIKKNEKIWNCIAIRAQFLVTVQQLNTLFIPGIVAMRLLKCYSLPLLRIK